MKDKMWFQTALIGFLMVFAQSVYAECPDLPGDITGDGKADVVDVQCTIISALYNQSPDAGVELLDCLGGLPNQSVSDLSCSGETNVVDVIMSLTYALGDPLNPELDSNGNDCHDACENLVELVATDVGAPEPSYQLQDLQPESDGYLTAYGLEAVDGVTVVLLLASW